MNSIDSRHLRNFNCFHLSWQQVHLEFVSNMKSSSSKKEARLLNKKRKLEALANISKLNDSDKEANRLEITSALEDSDDGASSTANEPSIKRSKSDALKSDVDTNGSAIGVTSVVLSDDDYAQLKRELNSKKRELKNAPKLRLKLFGDSASLAVTPSIRTPIFLTDIQHLIMYALFGSSSPCIPSRWCHLEKASKVSHTVVVVLDGLSLHHFSSYETIFERTTKIFENKLELVMPDDETSEKMLHEIITVPLTNARKFELVEKYGSLEAALNATNDHVLMMNSIFPVSNDAVETPSPTTVIDPDVEIFPRTQLLMSALQMVDEGYPLPLRGELANRYKDFVLTKDLYEEVTATSPMFALDCEMCRTSAGVNELTRISIINEKHESLYETLVCPQHKIVDYLTQYSGITPEMMKNVTKTLVQVQEDVRRILPADAILVGQSLHSDLIAMRMMHPYVIDTSVIFNITGDRRRKSKLQTLASEFLGEAIQKNPLGHDSIEDCSASLKLTKLKLNRGIEFGDAVLTNRRRFYEKNKQAPSEANSGQTTAAATATSSSPKDRSAAVVTSSETNQVNYQAIIDGKRAIGAPTTTGHDVNASPTDRSNTIRLFKTDSNKSAVQKTCEIALNHALTLTHLTVTEKSLQENKIEKSLRKIDQWIATVWENIAPHGLFIVLFGGNTPKNTASGVALLQTK